MTKYEQRKSALDQMRAFADAHPEMTDAQVEEYQALETTFDKLDATIKREEKIAAAQEKLDEGTTDPMVKSGDASATSTEEYRAAFDQFLAGADMSEYKAAMTVGVDADGGYIVPESYQKSVIQKLNTIGRTRSISNVIQTESTINIPVEGDAPTFAWIDEGGAYGETKSTFGKEQIKAWKLGGIIKVSEELLQDNMINFDDYMGNQIAKGIDKAESPAFAVGDGSSKPTGYAHTATVGSSSTTAAVAAVTADEWIDIYYDLKEEYRANAKWRMTDMTEKSLRKLKDGDGNYLYAAGLTAGERATLLGRPIVIDNDMAELGTGNKFAVIGDFENYQIADRGQMSIQRLNELYAANGYVGFKVYKRVDAKPTLAEAFNAGQNA
ncbi:MAG: phage major capsid protein [Sulfurimonas sp.]